VQLYSLVFIGRSLSVFIKYPTYKKNISASKQDGFIRLYINIYDRFLLYPFVFQETVHESWVVQVVHVVPYPIIKATSAKGAQDLSPARSCMKSIETSILARANIHKYTTNLWATFELT